MKQVKSDILNDNLVNDTAEIISLYITCLPGGILNVYVFIGHL